MNEPKQTADKTSSWRRGNDADVPPEFCEQLEQMLQRIQNGESVNIDDIKREHPEIASELEQGIQNIKFLEDIARLLGDDASENLDESHLQTREIGDFRIVKQIGRGGMGVVYEAQQLTINRKVALKILPMAALIDSRALQRFKNEVSAIATLEHPNIVSIYAVGEERGIHYFAMQLVQGQSLAAVIREVQASADRGQKLVGEVFKQAVSDIAKRQPEQQDLIQRVDVFKESISLDERHLDRTKAETVARGLSSTVRTVGDPTYFRKIARLIQHAAEALQHAHDFGIVHRDVKPGNLLLDAQGTLVVTDFGLARIESGAGVTMTGDMLGTLRYMSPEQVLGSHTIIDHRTDIYSLGATLYELLTLQPMWMGEDKAEIIRQISAEEPTRPGKINSRIPMELETVALKAVSKTPSDRYVSARSFADDLQRWLDNKPIVARRPTVWKHLSSWSYRHRGLLATGISAAVLSLSVGLFLAWSAYQREAIQRGRAEGNYQMALGTLSELVDNAGQHERMIDLEGWRRQTLENAISYYSRFAKMNTNDPANYVELVKVQDQLAKVYTLLEDYANAEKSAQAGIQLASDLQLTSTPFLDPLIEGRLWWHLGKAQQELSKTNPAGEAWDQANRLFSDTLEHASEPSGKLRLEVAEFLNSYAQWNLDSGNPIIAGQALRRASDLCRTVIEAEPENEIAREQQCEIKQDLADYYQRGTDRQMAIESLVAALNLAEGLNDTRGHLELRARCLRRLGRQYVHDGMSLPEAEKKFREAISIWQKLIADYPWDVYYHGDLAANQHNLASALIRQGKTANARDLLDQAQSNQSFTIRHKSENSQYQFYWVKHKGLQASIAQDLGNLNQADDLLQESIADLEQLVQRWPDHQEIGMATAEAHLAYGRLLTRLPRVRENPEILRDAESHVLAALTTIQHLEAQYGSHISSTNNFPGLNWYSEKFLRAYTLLSRIYFGMNNFDKAIDAVANSKSYLDRVAGLQSPKARYESGCSEIDLASFIAGVAISKSNTNGKSKWTKVELLAESQSMARDGIQKVQQAYLEDPDVTREAGISEKRIQFGFFILALTLYEQAKYSESKQEWKRATRLPAHCTNHVLQTYIEELISCPEESFRDYQQAIDLGTEILARGEKNDVLIHSVRLNIGIANFHLAEYKKAKNIIADILDNVFSVSAGYYLAGTLAKIDPKDDDEGLFHKEDAKTIFYLTEYRRQSVNDDFGNCEAVRDELVKILMIEQDSEFDILVDQAQALQDSGMFEPASEYWAQVVNQCPDDAHGWLAFGFCLVEAKKYEKSIEILQLAADFPINAPTANWNLGNAYAMEDQVDKAFEALNRAVDLGYGDLSKFQNMPLLEKLHSDDRFEQLLDRIRERQ